MFTDEESVSEQEGERDMGGWREFRQQGWFAESREVQ